MSQVTKRGAVEPSLNITPLIDVVFLLIVFFMLVNNIVTDDVPKVQLPELDDPNVYPAEGEKRVIVNIIAIQEHDGEYGPGQDVGEVLSREGKAEFINVGGINFRIGRNDGKKLENLKETMLDFREKCKGMIEARMINAQTPPDIMLRVDAAVHYAQVLPVMTNLQLAMAEALGGELAAKTPVHLVAYQGDD
ncbi:MAG: biopolymer transporter ExbD [Phycisphaeraceae bacterium]|nr:biopolymer transporter ExbD [Phycisphaeraceae bacterium]